MLPQAGSSGVVELWLLSGSCERQRTRDATDNHVSGGEKLLTTQLHSPNVTTSLSVHELRKQERCAETPLVLRFYRRTVSVAGVADRSGHGVTGPRSDHPRFVMDTMGSWGGSTQGSCKVCTRSRGVKRSGSNVLTPADHAGDGRAKLIASVHPGDGAVFHHTLAAVNMVGACGADV